MRAAKIKGAIQGTLGGPRLVHAKPKSPMVSSGAAGSIRISRALGGKTYCTEASIIELLVGGHSDLCDGWRSAYI